MKKILISGANSYIGNSFEKWIEKYNGQYSVDSICLMNDAWKEKDFSKYDVVFHVAGIAHIKETKDNANLYYTVNRDLAFEVAKKAKNNGIKQFIFLSSMSVYGIESGIIDEQSVLNPKSNYGKSKHEAEKLIQSIENEDFKVAIIRPPMVYGKDCKGNYKRLAKLATHIPVFPDVENKRSMIYIDNLSEFVKLLIDDCGRGLFFPQNEEYVKTSEMVKQIAGIHGKNIILTKLFNLLLRVLMVGSIQKMFGNLVYDKTMSEYSSNYCVEGFESSILLTEERDK